MLKMFKKAILKESPFHAHSGENSNLGSEIQNKRRKV
jgi:hypothetical protein